MPAVSLIKGDKMASGQADYRDALPVNMFAVPRDILGAAGYMYQMYGLTQFGTGLGVDRGGIWVFADGLEGHYRVSGTSFISVDESGNTTTLGTIAGSEQCSFAYSFNNVIVVGNQQLFYYNPTEGFREITSSGVVGNPIDVVWIDNYVFLTDGTDIYHSNILNEELFEATASTEPQYQPDKVFGLAKNKSNELVVLGEVSIQHYINTGAENFAFQNLGSKVGKLGILGTHCKAELEGIFYTLGRREQDNPSCYQYSLGSSQKIASREIEQVLSEYTPDELSATTIDTFLDDKMKLVIYHFPNDSYMFNATIAEVVGVENAWCKLESGRNNVNLRPYRAKNIILDPRNGRWVCGDKEDSTLGYLDDTVATHYSEIAQWIMFTKYLDLETLSINLIEMEIIPGITSDEDATFFISRTNDGRIYGQEWSEEYGMQYDYNNRVYRARFGYVRHWTAFKFRGASRSRMVFGLLNVEAS